MQFRLVVTCVAVLVVALLSTSCTSAQGLSFEDAVNYAVGAVLTRPLRPIWTGTGIRIWRWPMNTPTAAFRF
jgi:hypothetical protein